MDSPNCNVRLSRAMAGQLSGGRLRRESSDVQILQVQGMVAS
jgi:hypothetical protein